MDAEVDVFGIEAGRENAVGVIRGAGGGRSLIYNGHVDVVPVGRAENWRQAIRSRGGSTASGSGGAGPPI